MFILWKIRLHFMLAQVVLITQFYKYTCFKKSLFDHFDVQRNKYLEYNLHFPPISLIDIKCSSSMKYFEIMPVVALVLSSA